MNARLGPFSQKPRCWWCGSDPLYVAYHDFEWGIPVHEDGKLFEMLLLESFQAGLSWITILRKRENFRKAFAQFNPERVARFGAKQRARLMNDPGIIRNRAKIEAAIGNARAFLSIQEEFGSFDCYIWRFTDHRTLLSSSPRTQRNMPSTSPQSEAMSKDLKRRGFRFVGATVCYAHMQATGMVDDHVRGCFKYRGS